jgi:hypothetical protein
VYIDRCGGSEHHPRICPESFFDFVFLDSPSYYNPQKSTMPSNSMLKQTSVNRQPILKKS